MAARGLYDWSAQPCERDLSAVDRNELRRMRRLLIAAGKDDLARADDQRLLRDLRLCDADGQLYRAGLLLTGYEDVIRSDVPTYEYAYQFRPSPGSEATARFHGREPLLAALERLLDAVETRRSSTRSMCRAVCSCRFMTIRRTRCGNLQSTPSCIATTRRTAL